MRKIKLFSDYSAEKYGSKLYRLPIDLALGCPNRVERYGDGCTFCAEDGGRARHLSRSLDIPRQIAAGKEYLRSRYNFAGPYIAYFQSFTSTYAPVDFLRAKYEEALRLADFKMVIIGTRPDALAPEVIDYLKELNSRYELWIELGTQSSNDHTLRRINRGHSFGQLKEAVNKLAESQIKCAAHVILGLPGETSTDFRQTARDIARLPFGAVKLHQLQILKNSPLGKTYQSSNIPTLNEYEYAFELRRFLHELPEDWLVMRLTAEATQADLIAPRWWMSKGKFLEFFHRYFAESADGEFPGTETADGSRTLYHPGFRQHFHSLAGARGEAEKKFIEPSGLAGKLTSLKKVKILDVGFGLGMNSFASLRLGGAQEIIALENDLRVIAAAKTVYLPDSEERKILEQLSICNYFHRDSVSLRIIPGDARINIKLLVDVGAKFDLIFHDGFSPDVNPELWSYDLLLLFRKLLSHDGLVLSYSSSFAYLGGLIRAGFAIGETPAFGRRRGGTVAALQSDLISCPLRAKEMQIVKHSTAGVPYRDITLDKSRDQIINARAKLIARLRSRGIPKWVAVNDRQ